MKNNINHSARYYQVQNNGYNLIDTEIVVEAPVTLTVNGIIWLTFMCTPIHLEAMAVGFLYNEGLINSIEEVATFRVCDRGDNVDIWLYHDIEKPVSWRRTSGCTGGVTAVEEDATPLPSQLTNTTNGYVLPPKQVNNLIGELFQAQELYRRSGGIHTSALSDGDTIIVAAEDIGRHNTLDKLAGRCILEKIELKKSILISTGRISSEMLQKAARIGSSIVISRTSPSSLSIEIAEKRGITLIGYARRNRFNIYTHPHRILLHETIRDR
jgi:FdhD protein